MPDGSPITLHNAFLYFEDGTPVRVTEMQEIDLTTTETAEESEQNTISIARPQEITVNFRMSKCAFRRIFNRIAYGWRAKGHLRKKALKKALKMCGGGTIWQEIFLK